MHARIDALLLALVPLVMLGASALGLAGAPALILGVSAITLIAIASAIERGRPRLRQIMPTVTLAALAAAGRVLFAPIPDVKPVSAIAIIAGSILGPRSGFAVGALAALVSNAFFGQGAWTPMQMYAWGLVGHLAGTLQETGVFRRRGAVYAYGFLSGPLYGAILNGWHVLGFVHPLTWQSALLAYTAALPLDLLHGAATVAFLALIWKPWRRALGRVVMRYKLKA